MKLTPLSSRFVHQPPKAVRPSMPPLRLRRMQPVVAARQNTAIRAEYAGMAEPNKSAKGALKATLPGLPPGAQVVKDEAVLHIATPQLQHRTTRKLQLANGMQVYLVSDPDTEESATSMTIKAGSWQDLPKHPGTAHFLEHMLFMGTHQHPDEDDYQTYLADHGGQSNAYTAADHTTYYFSVSDEALPGALERFAGFFTDPLLKSTCIDRESKAVNSEYRGDVDKEAWRMKHVQATQNNPEHPASRFTIGSKETLRGLDSETLRAWYEQHYSANLMHLVVYSPKPLDELQAMVVEQFSAVPNRHLTPQHLDMPQFNPQQLGKLVYAETERKGLASLGMRWEIPFDLATDNEGWPATVVAYALGQEAAGSLQSKLKELGLATGVSAGVQHNLTGNAIMTLQVGLTEKGVAEYEKVAELCYAAIGQVQTHGVSQAVFDDIAAAGKRDYMFQSRKSADDEVQEHAEGLLRTSLAAYQDPLVAPRVYKPQDIQAVANTLKPDQCQFLLVAHPSIAKRQGAQMEPWMEVPYSEESIPASTLKAWASARAPSADFALPRANPFMPRQLGVLPLNANTPTEHNPRRVVDNAHMTVFSARDVHERTPRVNWTVDVLVPQLAEPNARTRVLRDLYVSSVNDGLTEVMADANLAGLSAGVRPVEGGLRISVDGYSDRAPALLDAVLAHVRGQLVDRGRFADIVQSMGHRYEDARLASPVGQALERLDRVRRANYVSREDIAAELPGVTYDQVQTFAAHLFDRSHVLATLVGNQRPEQERAVVDLLQQRIGGAAYDVRQLPKPRMQPPVSAPVSVAESVACKDSSVLLTLEHGTRTLENVTAQDLFVRIFHERFFDDLRTKQQTGYQVGAFANAAGDQLYTSMLVQPHRFGVDEVLKRMEKFIATFRAGVGTTVLTEAQFDNVKKALISELREPPRRMSVVGAGMHSQAFEYNGDFERLQKRIAAAQALTYSQFKAWVLEQLRDDNPHRVSVRLRGTQPMMAEDAAV